MRMGKKTKKNEFVRVPTEKPRFDVGAMFPKKRPVAKKAAKDSEWRKLEPAKLAEPASTSLGVGQLRYQCQCGRSIWITAHGNQIVVEQLS
jgi:hypothetical protein